MMRTAICLLIVIGTSVGLAGPLPQDHRGLPDFSGHYVLKYTTQTWRRDLKGVRRQLEIVQHGPEISFTRWRQVGGQDVPVTTVVHLDDPGEQVPPNPSPSPAVSTMRWDGKKLTARFSLDAFKPERAVRSLSASSRTPGSVYTYDIIEEWKLSRDGRTLTHDSRMYIPFKRSTERITLQDNLSDREVYRRM